jgi:hypothetical protein
MTELSPWVGAVAIEAVVVVVGFLGWRLSVARRAERALVDRIQSLRAELDVLAAAPPVPPPPSPPSPPRLVVFEDADLEALRQELGLGGEPANTEAARVAVEEAHRRFAEAASTNQALQGIVDGLLLTQADVVTRIGQLGGSEGLAPEVKARADEVIDVLRAADDALIAASDRVMENEGILGGGTAALARFVDGFDWDVPPPSARAMNGILAGKAGREGDAPAPSPAPAPARPGPDPAAIKRRAEEMAKLEARVKALTAEQARLRESLDDVNGEYLRMVEELRAPEARTDDASGPLQGA